MRLYEIQTRDAQGWMIFEYSTTLAAIKKRFNAIVKVKKDLPRSCFAYEITVRTDLKIADWLMLLQGDAPGAGPIELTPQDLITDRKVLRKWSKPDAN